MIADHHREQRCACGPARRQHAISSDAGLDLGTATLLGQRICPCTLFHLVCGRPLGNAWRQMCWREGFH